MAESNFVDSLPPGWTMKERIRGTGKRDKFYYAPKNGPIFNSKVEVYRYLNPTDPPHIKVKPTRRKKKKKRALSLNQHWKIIAVEKVKAEDLPRGLVGEIRERENDQPVRRDPSVDGQSVASRTRRRVSSGQSSAMNVSSHPLIESVEQEDEKSAERGKRRSPLEKAPELPRRSKRLAGIEADAVGLKTKIRSAPSSSSGNGVAGSDEIDKLGGAPLGLPLGELLSDPCIAFAIKILTGLTYDDAALPGTASSDNSPVNTGGDGPWKDPCIGFAIKTLTDHEPEPELTPCTKIDSLS